MLGLFHGRLVNIRSRSGPGGRVGGLDLSRRHDDRQAAGSEVGPGMRRVTWYPTLSLSRKELSMSRKDLSLRTRTSLRFTRVLALALLAGLAPGAQAFAQTDPLPSWNDGPAKKAIVEFVQATTDKASPKFVAPEARIATFDQDGTLWVEQPMYTQVIYCLERVPAVVKAKPALKDVEPFKTVLSGNREAMAKLSMKDLEKILAATLTGMTVEQFGAEVKAVAGDGEAPAVQAPLHRAGLSADARGDAVPARQRLQDLYRDRWRPGLRARVRRAGLRRPARAGGRVGGRDEVRLRQGRHGRRSPRNPSSC